MTKKHIDACVRESLEQYFKDLRGAEPAQTLQTFLAGQPMLMSMICAPRSML